MSTFQLYRPVLVVDDEADIRELIQMTLMKMGLTVEMASGVQDAKDKLSKNTYDLVLTDMRMPDGTGLEVIEYVNQISDTPIAVITAFGNADQAVHAIKLGAFDYIQKPITLAQLRTLVKSAIKIHEQPESNKESKKTKTAEKTATEKPSTKKTTPVKKHRLLGQSAVIQDLRRMIEKLAQSNVSVYITGESGTGKEQAARSIHEASARAAHPFIAVNCGAIPENLMESEFFGYKKGSFTGADADRDGFFQAAHQGTLFLDEVADLPLSMQVKLLRVIQEKAVRKIGEHTEKPIDVRIICATHKNLEQEVSEGRFRQDLYYRLNIVSLKMPSLRDLQEDLPFLIDELMKKMGCGNEIQLSEQATKALLQYSYPGNFRELENILERAVALSAGQTITPDDLQLNVVPKNREQNEDTTPMTNRFVLGKTSLPEYLDHVESTLIKRALSESNDNRTQAAQLLGVSFRSLRYRMERLDME